MSLIKFDLTEDHLKLLKNLDIQKKEIDSNISVPIISEKNLFGDTNIYNDIFLILYVVPNVDIADYNMFGEDDIYWNEEQFVYMKKLLSELDTALEIVLYTQSFKPGTYKTKSYIKDWKLIS